MLSLKCNVLVTVRDTLWIKYRQAVAYWHLNGLQYNWVVRSVRMSLFSISTKPPSEWKLAWVRGRKSELFFHGKVAAINYTERWESSEQSSAELKTRVRCCHLVLQQTVSSLYLSWSRAKLEDCPIQWLGTRPFVKFYLTITNVLIRVEAMIEFDSKILVKGISGC